MEYKLLVEVRNQYGGNRQSALGREGVKSAMEDMTNVQMVMIRLNS